MPRADRVGYTDHHDRDRACSAFGGGNSRGAPGNDEAHVRANQLDGEVIERLMRLAECRLEAHVLTLDQPVLPQPDFHSGKMKGMRCIWGGRAPVRRVLYMGRP